MAEMDDAWFYNNFNTKLSPEEEAKFQKWLKHESKRQGRDISMDLYTYDVRGFWRGSEKRDKTGHGTDRYKKPSHPTFSDESIYHMKGVYEGGRWDKDGAFHPGKTNLKYHGREGIQREFDREPGRPEHLAPADETAPNIFNNLRWPRPTAPYGRF